jgi:hypothetical protein
VKYAVRRKGQPTGVEYDNGGQLAIELLAACGIKTINQPLPQGQLPALWDIGLSRATLRNYEVLRHRDGATIPIEKITCGISFYSVADRHIEVEIRLEY